MSTFRFGFLFGFSLHFQYCVLLLLSVELGWAVVFFSLPFSQSNPPELTAKTPLHYAAKNQDQAMVQWLLKQPTVKTDVRDARGMLAADYAHPPLRALFPPMAVYIDLRP